MDALTVGFFGAGLALLVAGANLLVKGASRLARAAGISPLVVGLTVVAYGTSAPELAVSLKSALQGQADIALGNVVGSNIFNVLFILGASATIVPLVVSARLVRLDVPLMILASVLLFLMGVDGRIGRLDGALLLACAIGYTWFTVDQSRREGPLVEREYEEAYVKRSATARLWIDAGTIGVGLGLLVLGARWLVESAVAVARGLGVSELVVGLTIVAAGTSLPEVATSIVAALRGERDIAVGNVVGSNIFNILVVLGLSAAAAHGGVAVAPAAFGFDIPVMIAAAAACLPILFTGHLIARWEGLLFLGYYVAYTAYVILAASQHDALPLFSRAMGAFALPLTLVTLAIGLARPFRGRRAEDGPGATNSG